MTNSWPNTVEELLSKAVSFNTVTAPISGNPSAEKELGKYYSELAQGLNFTAQFFPVPGLSDNLLICYQVSDTSPWILFESHMDTVTTSGMTIDPFKTTIEDHKIFGRGTCDTKGSGAAMFWALKQYALSNKDKSNNIALLFTVNEEAGMKGAIAFAKALADLKFKPEAVIVGEPTMLQPVVAHNGCARIKIITKGVAAHSSNPENGHSAISDMARVILAFEEDYIPKLKTQHSLTGKPQCSINVIHGGSQPNVIADYCEVSMDRRITPNESPEQVISDIQAQVEALNSKYPKMNCEVQVLYLNPPLEIKENSVLLKKTQNIISQHGINFAAQGAPYCTEAGHFCNKGIDTLVIGPGDIAQAHTKDEWLALDQLDLAVEVYRELMETN